MLVDPSKHKRQSCHPGDPQLAFVKDLTPSGAAPAIVQISLLRFLIG